MNPGYVVISLSLTIAAYAQRAPARSHGGAGRPAGHTRGVATMPRQGSIAGPSPNVNHAPADVTGRTFFRPPSTFSRSYVTSAPYLNPSFNGPFVDSGFVPGAVPQHPTGNPPKWLYNDRFAWMGHRGHSQWGPFNHGYQLPGQGSWTADYGYYPFSWGGDGSFLLVGDSALRAWNGEPVNAYFPDANGGYMPIFSAAPPALPDGMAFAQFTGVPETIVLDFPPGSRVRR